MRAIISFFIFSLIFLLALYGLKNDQVFEVFGICAVLAFLAAMCEVPVISVLSYGVEHKIISAIASAIAAIMFCCLSFGIIFALRFIKEVI